jgi:glyceraldehyde 3-phosphate dehydrogenase
MIKVAINGFGRIGRSAFRVYFDKFREEMQVVAINDLVDPAALAYLLKYDSVYGIWSRDVSGEKSVNDIKEAVEGESVGKIVIDGVEIPTFATKDPTKLPWSELMVDVVIESTGRFTKQEQAQAHITAGAKKVVISAPSRDAPTFLLGVKAYDGESQVINMGSCTTNCVGPVAKVIDDTFGIVKSAMTTIHGYTAEQNLVDGPPPPLHPDLRRARAAAVNIVPTSTGAATAVAKVLEGMEGKFDGMAFRVPVICGSISDFPFLLAKKATVEEVNDTVKATSKESPLKGILAISHEPLVSSDIIGRPESAIVDLSLTKVVDGDLVKVFAWYDNEFGYSNRLIEQVIQVGKSTNS